MRRFVSLVLGVGLASSAALLPVTAAHAAPPEVRIGGFGIEYAPKDRDGAIVLPWMGCGGSGSNIATVENVETNKTIRRSWNFGMSFVFVRPGTYRVSIQSTCDGASDSFVGTRTVKRESDRNTVTKAEFKLIKKGMSLARVKKIVGNSGLGSGSVRLLDHRGTFGWAELSVKKGKVIGKWWHAEVGDTPVR